MAKVSSYPKVSFSSSQQSVAYDPSRAQVVRVENQEYLDAAIEELKDSGDVVVSVDTLDEAIATDFEQGIFILTGGETTTLDGGQGLYRVSSAGSGGTEMDNGYELVPLFVVGTGDGELPTAEYVVLQSQIGTESGDVPLIDSVPLTLESIEDIPDLSGHADRQKFDITGYYSGTTVGGGTFVKATGRHDGVIYFDPDRVSEIGTSAYYVDSGSDAVCLMRVDVETILVEMAGAGGSIDSISIQAAIDTADQYGKISVTNGATYTLTSDVTVLEKGRPDDNVFELDFSGCNFTGSFGFIFDSNKNLRVIGLHVPESYITLRGVWFSAFHNCKASTLNLIDVAGTSFSASYWINFHGCIFQEIVKGSTGFATNALNFYGCQMRGTSGQGFSGTKDYALVVPEGAGNVQNWNWYGGDISYYNTGILNIDSLFTDDLELTFDGVYWDSEVPSMAGLASNQWVKNRNTHIAGKIVNSHEFETSLRADAEFNGSVFSAGWKSYQPLNMIRNGDMAQFLTSYSTSYGGPIGSFLGTITEVDDASIGLYLNLSVGDGDSTATLCRFRSSPLLATGRYSGVVIARNADSGTRNLNFSIGGQFFDADVNDDWTVIAGAGMASLPAGGFQDILMRSTDGSGYNIDIRYIGLVLGAHPPMICPCHPTASGFDQVRATELLIGNAFLTSRPGIYTGSGSPEGNVSAVVSSVYLRADGGSSTSFYVKESGTGNTGWAAK